MTNNPTLGGPFSVFKVIKAASPSAPADIRRVHTLLRAGKVQLVQAEREKKIVAG